MFSDKPNWRRPSSCPAVDCAHGLPQGQNSYKMPPPTVQNRYRYGHGCSSSEIWYFMVFPGISSVIFLLKPPFLVDFRLPRLMKQEDTFYISLQLLILSPMTPGKTSCGANCFCRIQNWYAASVSSFKNFGLGHRSPFLQGHLDATWKNQTHKLTRSPASHEINDSAWQI